MDAYTWKEIEVNIGGEVLTFGMNMPAEWTEEQCYEYAVAFVYDEIDIEVH